MTLPIIWLKRKYWWYAQHLDTMDHPVTNPRIMNLPHNERFLAQRISLGLVRWTFARTNTRTVNSFCIPVGFVIARYSLTSNQTGSTSQMYNMNTVWPLNIQTLFKLHRHLASPNFVWRFMRRLHLKHLSLPHTERSIKSVDDGILHHCLNQWWDLLCLHKTGYTVGPICRCTALINQQRHWWVARLLHMHDLCCSFELGTSRRIADPAWTCALERSHHPCLMGACVYCCERRCSTLWLLLPQKEAVCRLPGLCTVHHR